MCDCSHITALSGRWSLPLYSLSLSHFGFSQGFCSLLPQLAVAACRKGQVGDVSECPSSFGCWDGLWGSPAAIPESPPQAEMCCSPRRVADQTAPRGPALALVFDGDM